MFPSYGKINSSATKYNSSYKINVVAYSNVPKVNRVIKLMSSPIVMYP